MSTKEKLEATERLRNSIYERMTIRDASIKNAKDSGKPHGMLDIWGKRSKEDRDSIKELDELIKDLTTTLRD